MRSLPTSIRAGAVLLATALVWLVSVTLCSTRVVAETAHDGEHLETAEHAEHSHGSPHQDGSSNEGCGCESFKAFPAQATSLAKAPLPPLASPLYLILQENFSYASRAAHQVVKDTGPPKRLSFAHRMVSRCVLSHAPPLVA